MGGYDRLTLGTATFSASATSTYCGSAQLDEKAVKAHDPRQSRESAYGRLKNCRDHTGSRIGVGFDIDTYGVGTKTDGPLMPPPEKYGLGYATLKKIAESVSQNAAGSCSLERASIL